MKKDIDLYVIGIVLNANGKEIGWMAEGVYLSEAEAIDNCKTNEFILLVSTGTRFPEDAVDARKIYWPKKEKWEESKLYKLKHSTTEKK